MEKTEEEEEEEEDDQKQQQQKGPNFAADIHSRKTLDLRKLSNFNI